MSLKAILTNMIEAASDSPQREIEVGIDDYQVTDFSDAEIVKTGEVKRCVVIVGYSSHPLRGGIFHMTVFGNLQNWADLISQNLVSDYTQIDIFGGDKVSWEKFSSLPSLLRQRGFTVHTDDALWTGKIINNISLDNNGKIKVE